MRPARTPWWSRASRRAVIGAPSERTATASTAYTRAFTGKPARGIENGFLVNHDELAPSAYPELHHLTAPVRAAARERGDHEALNLWAGQTHELAHDLPAVDVVALLGRGGAPR